MTQLRRILLASLVLAIPTFLWAADPPPAGSYKVLLGGGRVFWLLKLEMKDGKWSGSTTSAPKAPSATVEKVKFDNGKLEFTLNVMDEGSFTFEGLPAKKDGKILGTFSGRGHNVLPVQLDPTTLTSFDPFEVSREALAKSTDELEVTEAAMMCLSQAADKKAKPDEAKSWAERAVKASEAYGPKWRRSVVMQLAEILANQEGFTGLALDYAEQAEKDLVPATDSPTTQKRVLTLLADALDKAGRKEDAKKVRDRSEKIAAIQVKPFTGRKGKSDRVALVESFTCAQQAACVAQDNAVAALLETFKPSEVVVLQYHLNVPGPDPLSCSEAETRAKFYETSRSTPAIFFNGKKEATGGGTAESQARYEQFTETLAGMLEKTTKVKLTATATRKGNKIDIKTDVADLPETGPDIRLRIAVVEDQVAFTGGNKVAKHVQVVRHFPNGAAGTALRTKAVSDTHTVDLDVLNKNLKAYYDKINEATPFPTKDRPVDLKKLRVVAFVQNDETGEILNAVQVDVKGE